LGAIKLTTLCALVCRVGLCWCSNEGDSTIQVGGLT
jgi:hypothetical protein